MGMASKVALPPIQRRPPELGAGPAEEWRADLFYEDFKDALRAVGLRFGEMHLARVIVAGSDFTVRYGNRSVTLHLGGSRSQSEVGK